MEPKFSENDIIEYSSCNELRHAVVIEVHPAAVLDNHYYRCLLYDPITKRKECDFWIGEYDIIKKVDHKGQPIFNTWEELLTA